MHNILDKAKQFFTSKKGVVITAGALAFFTLSRMYFSGGVCRADRDLTGQVIVVTGGSAGIGKQTIKQISSKGCTIIFGARDQAKSEKVVQQILQKEKDCKIYFFPLDLADKKSIVEFSLKVKEQCDHIDILVNNAGVSLIRHQQTKDGFEMNMGTNHLGHFYLTYLLWDHIKKVEKPRIINVSSLAHKGRGFSGGFGIDFNDLNQFDKEAYGRSKLANVLFTRELQHRMDNAGVQGLSLTLHPGVIMTEVFRDFGVYFTVFKLLFWPLILLCFKTPEQGAQTTLYLILQDEQKLQKGEYYRDCKVAESSAFSRDRNNAEKLWQVSQKLLGIKFDI